MNEIPTINDRSYKIAVYMVKAVTLGGIGGALLFALKAMTTHKQIIRNEWKDSLSENVQFMNNHSELCKFFYTIQQEYQSVDPDAYHTALIKCDHLLHIQNVVVKEMEQYRDLYESYHSSEDEQELESLYENIRRGQALIFTVWQEMFDQLKKLRSSIFHQEKEQYMFHHHAKAQYDLDQERYRNEHNAWMERKNVWELSRKDELSALARARRKNLGIDDGQNSHFSEPEPVRPSPVPEHLSQTLRTEKYEKLMEIIATMTMDIVQDVKGKIVET